MVYYTNINKHIILYGIFWCSIMSMTTRCSRRRLSYGPQTTNQADVQVSTVVCALCKASHKCMSKVQSWQNAQACELVSKLGITLDDIICRPCRDDIRRVLANCSYIPRWGKRNKLTKCCVKGCPDVCFVHSKVTDACTIKRIFEDKCLETEGNIPVPTPLCLHHYYMVYNTIQPQQTHCPTCGISLKHVPTRPCPNESNYRRVPVLKVTLIPVIEYVFIAINHT